MSFEIIISLISIVILIIWGIAWEQMKEKLIIRIERLEEDVRVLVKDVDELRKRNGMP